MSHGARKEPGGWHGARRLWRGSEPGRWLSSLQVVPHQMVFTHSEGRGSKDPVERSGHAGGPEPSTTVPVCVWPVESVHVICTLSPGWRGTRIRVIADDESTE